jgi:hypothetical protein
MQKLHFLAATTVILGATACPTVDPTDDFDTILTTIDDEADDDDDDDTTEGESGTDDNTTEATTEADDDVETTADTTDGSCGSLGCDCTDTSTCDAPLECVGGTCQLPGAEMDTTEETTADTGELGDCDPNNEYCLPNGCMGSMGQGLTLDTDMDGVADIGWCLYACENMDASMCPTLDGAQIQCVQWNMMGDQACFPLCQLANDTCPMGMVCYDAGLGQGIGICVSDAEGFG